MRFLLHLFRSVLVVAGVIMGPLSLPASAQESRVALTLSGPEHVAPGSEIAYSLTVENPTQQSLFGLLIYDYLPSGTTLLSVNDGGQYDAEYGYVWWTLDELPAFSYVTVTFTVQAPDVPDYILANAYYGVIYDNDAEIVGNGAIYTTVVGNAVVEGADVNLVGEFTIFHAQQPGEQDLIEITLQNLGSAPVEEVFYVDLFFNPVQPVLAGGLDWTQVNSALAPTQGIEWAVNGIGAGERLLLTTMVESVVGITPMTEYTSWDGRLPEGVTDVYVYVDSWAANGSSNGIVRETNEQDNSSFIQFAPAGPTPTPATPTPQPTPLPTPGANPHFEYAIDFRSNPHGFGFANWGDNQYPEDAELDTATLIRMFGAQNVCVSGSTPQDCVLTGPARAWRNQELADVDGGHCYGMAVVSQRIFVGLDAPANYQDGVTQTIDLLPHDAIRAAITEFAVTQSLMPADGSSDQWVRKQGLKPSEVLNKFAQRFQTHPNDPYVLGFLFNGEGHAVTPYAIENKGNGIYWLYVYDNNAPGETRYMVFDLNRETWQYAFGAINPAQPPNIWEGSARTDTLVFRPTSAHLNGGWACPFCNETVSASGVRTTNSSVTFELFGQGEVLVLDSEQRAIGYDFERDQFINEIAGSDVMPKFDGLGVESAPTLRLPLQAANDPYTVYVAGKTEAEPVNADMFMFGPGYAVGLSALQINPGQDLLMTMRPDGRQITFNASQQGTVSPDIVIAVDSSDSDDSYLFGIGGFALDAFKTVTVTLALEQGLLYFTDDDGGADTYALEMLRIRPDGSEAYYENANVELSRGADAAMNFGAWDGSGGVTFNLAGQETVLANERAQPPVNHHIYLPSVMR